MKRDPTTEGVHHSISGFRARFSHERSRIDVFVDWMTSYFGSAKFLFFNVTLFTLWILVNTGVFGSALIFDPFPFDFLTTAVSLQAIFLAIVVLMSQNRAAHIADLREEMDFEINVRAEAEITRMLNMLDEIHDHLGLEESDDDELVQMKKRIDVGQIKREIEDGQ